MKEKYLEFLSVYIALFLSISINGVIPKKKHFWDQKN